MSLNVLVFVAIFYIINPKCSQFFLFELVGFFENCWGRHFFQGNFFISLNPSLGSSYTHTAFGSVGRGMGYKTCHSLPTRYLLENFKGNPFKLILSQLSTMVLSKPRDPSEPEIPVNCKKIFPVPWNPSERIGSFRTPGILWTLNLGFLKTLVILPNLENPSNSLGLLQFPVIPPNPHTPR